MSATEAASTVTVESVREFLTGRPEGAQYPGRPNHARRNLAILLWDLHDHGPATNDSGQATQVLRDRLDAGGLLVPGNKGAPPWQGRHFIMVLSDLAEAGLITRQIKGKRTFRIALNVPGKVLEAAGFPRPRKLAEVKAERDRTIDVGPVEVIEEAPPPPPLTITTEPEPELPTVELDGLAAAGILIQAMQLLGRAIPMIPVAPPSVPDDVLGRLADTLEENQRLRRKLADSNDLVHALTTERDGLRKAKLALEANLDNMAKGSLNEQQYRRFVELDRVVRAAPGTTKGPD